MASKMTVKSKFQTQTKAGLDSNSYYFPHRLTNFAFPGPMHPSGIKFRNEMARKIPHIPNSIIVTILQITRPL